MIKIIREKMNHESQGTYTVVKRPPHTHLIPLTWVLTTKTNVDGSIDKFKARLVAAGNQQPISPGEVNAAPTTDQPIVKIILSTALQFGWSLKQADVKAAYLHADIQQEVYARFPTYADIHFPDFNPATDCLKLEKALYGLRASGRNWYDFFAAKLRGINFHSLHSYETVFTKTYPTGIVICMLYVDDCLLTGTNETLITQAYNEIRLSGVALEKVSDLDKFLGLNYNRVNKHSLDFFRPPSESTSIYASKASPATPTFQEYLTDDVLKSSPVHPFRIRSTVGDLNYTALACRPDLAFESSVVEVPSVGK